MTDQEKNSVELVGDPQQRLALADRIAATLRTACPGSQVSRRGSLAAGYADDYSDIDLAWVVPDDRFGAALGSASAALASVAPLVSFRSDPDHQRSPQRRLLFVRFAGVPLLWRLDLEVWAQSVAFDNSVDNDPSAHGQDWCPYESALLNALAAIKATLRGRIDDADAGLTRGFERVGSDPLEELAIHDRVVALVNASVDSRPHLREFGQQIVAAAGQYL